MKRAQYEELKRALEEVAAAARNAKQEIERKVQDHKLQHGAGPSADELVHADRLERVARSIEGILGTVTVVD